MFEDDVCKYCGEKFPNSFCGECGNKVCDNCWKTHHEVCTRVDPMNPYI